MTEETVQTALLGKVAAYTQILQKDPRSTIFVSLAEAYRKLGLFDDALRIVDAGLAIHPEFSPAYIVRARALCQRADYAGSAEAFDRALQFDENSLAGLVGYARLAALTDNIGQARELLLRARELSPADPVINKFLNSLPPVADAVQNQDKVAPVVTAPLVSETLADLYLKQGLPEKALEILRELQRSEPDNLRFRRLIRDAELQARGVTAAADSASAEPEVVPEPIAEDLIEESGVKTESAPAAELQTLDDMAVISSAETQESEVPPVETIASNQDTLPPLEIFNRWLENIQRRRANV